MPYSGIPILLTSFEKSKGLRNRRQNYSVQPRRGNYFWFEVSGGSKNWGFENSGFHCTSLRQDLLLDTRSKDMRIWYYVHFVILLNLFNLVKCLGAFHSTQCSGLKSRLFRVTNGIVFSGGFQVFARKYETNKKKINGGLFTFLTFLTCFPVACSL